MSQLAHLRQKIKSIQTTRKVTHALRLVSMSLYSKLEKQDATLKYYTKTIRDLFIEHLQYAPDWKNPVLLPNDPLDSNPLFIIVSSSRGLCGSLNSNLFRYIESTISIKEHQKASYITIGSKAYKFVKERAQGTIEYSYNELNSNNFITIADALVEKILNAPMSHSSVVLFGTERRSFVRQNPLKASIIPLIANTTNQSETEINKKNHEQNEEIIWEQSNKEILEVLSTGYLRCSIIDMLFQSLLSEYSARFLAMDSSTTNANKFLERLTMQYNKVRQAAITKEVAELSAGFIEH